MGALFRVRDTEGKMLGKHSNCYFNSFTSILLLFNQSKLLQNPSPTHPFPFLSHSPFPTPLPPTKEGNRVFAENNSNFLFIFIYLAVLGLCCDI